MSMGKVTSIARGKTEQRVAQVIKILKAAREPLSYDDIRILTGAEKQPDRTWRGGMAFDTLMYVTTTLQEVGLVVRAEVARGPGHPRVYFVWKANAKAMSALDGGFRISA